MVKIIASTGLILFGFGGGLLVLVVSYIPPVWLVGILSVTGIVGLIVLNHAFHEFIETSQRRGRWTQS